MFNSSSFIKKSIILIMILLFSLPIYAQSTLVTIAEDASATTSSLANTSEYTFNELSNGINNNVSWDGVGTFDSLYISNSNVWGGAIDESTGQASQFSWQGNNWTPVSTLSLNENSSYFGFWWSAGDKNNQLSFYNDDELVARYTTESMFGSLNLSQDYYGNPLTGGNGGEPYAFINFFGDAETSWNKIELTQNGGGGFESDNYTTRVETFNPETDSQESLGNIIAEVSGTETTNVDTPSEDWAWAFDESAPGAPNPPFFALLFFLAAFIKTKFSS
ncbi:hypothetical protein LNTAR_05421 [Lentisphaera araneosa HTCC2155]|uniref:PEP-CTERM sorting domain-containing protein n=1 Tax=Lentisphaera araneosa HTCC2155 TaxID=313628 RepID=A6DLS1_9BACT|nr:hypothetical protein [Lentisphaera araneosa]EDM27526.1 hypothetical protein LNTAR_05421 [Lentisphaera araneosa HTCC2155]